MSKSVKQMFDFISDRYDLLNHMLTAGRDVAWRKKAVSLLPHDKELMILDMCGGTGDFLNQCNNKLRVAYGLLGDFSFNMLAKGKAKVEKNGHKEIDTAVQLDALAVPIKDATFDVVLNGFGMRNLDSVDVGIKEVVRVLKDGGEFITLEFFRPTNCITNIFYNYIAPVMIPLPSLIFKKHIPAYKYLVDSIRNFMSAEEYAAQCEKNGLYVKNIIPCEKGIAYIVHVQKGSGCE